MNLNYLILSVTAGEGHNSTAKAIKAELESRSTADCAITCSVLDTYKYVSPELAKIISDGYLIVAEKAKYAYRIGYSLAEMRKRKGDMSKNLINYVMASDLAKFINSDNYDVIIFTHPFSGILLNVMKKRGMISNRTLGILTDFTFHPYWENCTDNDYVVMPDKLLLPQGLRKGFRKDQLLPFGIPINPSFSLHTPKEEAREKLGLNTHLPTFLVMGGSMGYGNMGDTVKKIDACGIDRDFQLICVCGSNETAKKEVDEIAETSRHKILVTGFVNYISTIMDASDCIITKPGGLTTSESLAKGLPMIIVNPIPGQEERNTQFLMNTGCALSTTRTCPIDECMYQLLASESRLRVMRESISEIGKPNSTSDTADFLIDLAKSPAKAAKIVADTVGEDGKIYFDVRG